jgi:hypothetical protein
VSGPANINSIEVLARLKLAVDTFREEANEALGGAAMVIQRYIDWIEHDRVKHWENQIRRGWERIAEAQAELERCQLLAMDGERKTCHDEKQALDLAKRRLRRAEEQLEAVRHWRGKLQHEILEYRARAGQLGNWIEAEQPKAAAALGRMFASLSAYVEMQAPQDDGPAQVTSMARDADASTKTAPPATSDDQSGNQRAEDNRS